MHNDNILYEKSINFAEKIISLYKVLTFEKKEYVLSKQLLRSATSIGANVCEAAHGQTPPDFYAKLKIADKESAETEYWIELLKRGKYIDETTFYSLKNQLDEIRRIIVASCKTFKQNEQNGKYSKK